MYLKVTVRAQDYQIIKVDKRLSLIVLVALLTRRVFMMNMQTTGAAIISTDRTPSAKYIQYHVSPRASVFPFMLFKGLHTLFSSATAGILKKILIPFLAVFLEPSCASCLIVLLSA